MRPPVVRYVTTALAHATKMESATADASGYGVSQNAPSCRVAAKNTPAAVMRTRNAHDGTFVSGVASGGASKFALPVAGLAAEGGIR